MYLENKDFWATPGGSNKAPLAFLIPGGSGTNRPRMRGFDAIAAALWLRGFNVFIFDNPQEPYSMATFCAYAKEHYRKLCKELEPSHALLHGSCVGGAFATQLAIDPIIPDDRKLLSIWETPLKFPNTLNRKLADRARKKGVIFADHSVVNIAGSEGKIRCPVHIGCGYKHTRSSNDREIFNEQQLDTLRGAFYNAPVIAVSVLKGADHDLSRGSDTGLLRSYIATIYEFSKAHFFCSN